MGVLMPKNLFEATQDIINIVRSSSGSQSDPIMNEAFFEAECKDTPGRKKGKSRKRGSKNG